MDIKETKSEVTGKSLAYISAALGLVAGLAWNEAITAMIDALFPLAKDTVLMKFVYAAVITAAVVVVVKYLDRLTNKKEGA